VLGIGTATPRLSWWLTPDEAADPADAPEVEAYQVEVSTNGQTDAYDVDGPAQTLVPWPAAALQSRQQADVRVRVRAAGDWSDWSEPVRLECGLLQPSDWSAQFVTTNSGGRAEDPAPVLQGSFHLDGDIADARLYITALGLYRASINGTRVGREELAPGWTSYQHRLRYQTYDVSDLLRAGDNQIEVTLGQGWYRGRIGFTGNRALYGPDVAALAQLEVTTAGGERQVVTSDASWTAGTSGILLDEIYDGQRVDLRVTDVKCTDPVRTVDVDRNILVAPVGPPVRVTEVVAAQRVFTSPSGARLIDFGQNLVGWVRLKVRGGQAGSEVVIRHAEVLEDGELGVRPLRTAKATDSYLLAGTAEEILEPCFTFHGFRYAEVSGVDELAAADVEAVVIGSDLTRTGWFSSSHDLLNQLHDNVVWGTRGNFVDVPTDCPQRDERLGWTGDIEVFAPSASFLFDTAGFLDSWLADLAAEQHADGSVPFVIPDVTRNPEPAAAAWSDAACIVPWVLYERFGDAGILARQLPSMRAWVDKIDSLY
jgi:alpha-L-rhamnosidase